MTKIAKSPANSGFAGPFAISNCKSQVIKDSEIYYLACENAIELINKYGTKEQFADIKPVLESSVHPEKEGILETYNKIVEKNK